MRSTLFLAALAAGTAHAYEKRVYVTDWTTVTVTKTVTAPAVTETITPVQQVQVADTVLTTTTQAPAVVETSSSELAKKSTEAVPANEPATTQAAQVEQEPATSWFSTAWTSTFEAASTTLKPQATSSSTTQAAASTSTGADVSSLPGGLTEDYKQAVLYNHNIHRSNHSVSSLDWHDHLYLSAWELAERCVYEHDTSINREKYGRYGQNIGYGVTKADVGQMITNLMYNDEIGYFPTPYGAASPSMDLFDKWGHFSQIIWKGTTHVACATKTCDTLGNVDSSRSVPFTVCNYSPPGNYNGEYGDNVLAPGDASTYTA